MVIKGVLRKISPLSNATPFLQMNPKLLAKIFPHLPFFFSKITWGAGIGGRYMRGLGPLRMDLAFPLKQAKDDPHIGFYVGIGQAF